MKTIPAYPFFFLLPFFFLPYSVEAQGDCDPKTLIEECKGELPPYSYSNSRTIMTKRGASREISVSLLSGEKYRMVFNVSHLPEEAVIEIYDGPGEKSGRDLLMSSEDLPDDQNFFLYDHPNEDGGDLYVQYDIPPPTDQSCFTFVVGYQLTFVN